MGTAKDQKQVKGTTYCQSHQAKSIRKIMVDTMQKTASSGDIQNLVKNLLVDTIASDITKQVKSIYPLENVHVQKVKTIKRPTLNLESRPPLKVRRSRGPTTMSPLFRRPFKLVE